MQADAPAKMTTDTGPCACVAAVISGLAPPRSVAVLKVTFHPLDIFLPRSKLRRTVTPDTAIKPAITPGIPGLF